MAHLLAASCLWGAACGAPEELPGSSHQEPGVAEPGSETAAAGVDGTLLYRRELGPGHTISFYDFGDGLVGINESMPLDGPGLFMATVGPHNSLAAVYRKLNPGRLDVPAGILAADRQVQLMGGLVPVREVSGPSLARSLTPAPEAAVALSSCSADVGGDNWGADWFQTNLCFSPPADAQRGCLYNMGSVQAVGAYNWSNWIQMEGDHNVAGWIKGTFQRCGGGFCVAPRIIVNRSVPPRAIEWWEHSGASDTVRWRGDSPCSHAHVAFKYK